MRAYDIIYKTREGMELGAEEIEFLLNGYTSGSIPDYQMAAWCMAVFFRGLTDREVFYLTKSMVNSGDVIDLSFIKGIKVDKHSTGGVGDKTTLVLAPVLAACGLKVAKLSGRGLGHTGGTVDKLLSIPGFTIELTPQRFIQQVSSIGFAIATQTQDLVPADKKLYSLRDVTATVESLPLIAASIMSKKLSSGADAIILDVKVGSGALMRTLDEASALAELMVKIGRNAGKKVRAVLTNMDQPLGRAVGNALEVVEAIQTLKAEGPWDFQYLCQFLAANTLVMTDRFQGMEEALEYVENLLKSGKPLERFKDMLKYQGADGRIADNPEQLVKATIHKKVHADACGWIAALDAREIGLAAMTLGVGREKKDDLIDPYVGIVLHKKIGYRVSEGDELATVYANDEGKAVQAVDRILRAYRISDKPVEEPRLVLGVME